VCGYIWKFKCTSFYNIVSFLSKLFGLNICILGASPFVSEFCGFPVLEYPVSFYLTL